ncbi:MAG: tetratricopeptide repeat protein [Aureliella sp.]
MDAGEYEQAAKVFVDPMRRGTAWFRAGEFDRAEREFARSVTAEAEYNRGNCLVMLGQYKTAIERYDRALKLRPNWQDAETNRSIAIVRAERVQDEGGDMGDQKLGADEIRFDNKKSTDGQETQVEEEQAISDSAMQALWLRRVQSKPADFLRAKFAYQLANEATSGTSEDDQ